MQEEISPTPNFFDPGVHSASTKTPCAARQTLARAVGKGL
jgi:hypothetical protein